MDFKHTKTLLAGACLLLLVFCSFTTNHHPDLFDLKDLADTSALAKYFHRADSAVALKTDTAHYFTLHGTVKGEHTAYWWGRRYYVHEARPLAKLWIGLKHGKQTVLTDQQGRFTITLPINCTDTLLVKERGCGAGPWGYSGKDIPVKNINRAKQLNVGLAYTSRPWIIYCPCF